MPVYVVTVSLPLTLTRIVLELIGMAAGLPEPAMTFCTPSHSASTTTPKKMQRLMMLSVSFRNAYS